MSDPRSTTPPSPSVEFQLKGTAGDEGRVSVRDFVAFLESAVATLRHLERETTSGGRATVEYQIVDLSIGSAVVAIEGVSRGDNNRTAGRILGRFSDGVAALRDGRLADLGHSPRTIASFEAMLAPLRRGLAGVTIVAGAARITLDREAARPAQPLALQTTGASVGDYSGFIDAVNVHRDPVFYLYPTVGPTKIACVFDHSLTESVSHALKKYCTVHGLIEYSVSALPSRIVVDRVEVNPPAAELPTLGSLWGIAPLLTGGVDSVEYLGQIRDAEA